MNQKNPQNIKETQLKATRLILLCSFVLPAPPQHAVKFIHRSHFMEVQTGFSAQQPRGPGLGARGRDGSVPAAGVRTEGAG